MVETSDSETLISLKAELKQLKQQKGIASKAVGEARKLNLPPDHEIAAVKNISQQIGTVEAAIKAGKTETISPPAHSKQSDLLPPQFQQKHIVDNQNATLTIEENLSATRWDEYINNHPNATIYHSSAIRQVIEATFGHTGHYLAAIDDADQIQGVLPLIEMKSRLFGHFIISMPFFNYGGILSNTSNAEQALLLHAQNLAKQTSVSHIEYRHTEDHINLPSISAKVAMLRTLPKTSDCLWEEIGTKVRAQIKKAQRQNTKVVTGREDLVDDFYRVFSQNMRDLGTPVYSKQLFINMLQNCQEASIIVVYLNEKPVSTGFLLGWRNTVEIPWASTLREANQYDCNMLLYWEILKFAINQSYEIFDFGRSNKEASTYRFKKQWGAKPKDLYWHYWIADGAALPEINPKNPKFQLIISLWKMLPVIVTRLIGPHIVKNIP
jgi:serine/alanine adding enzyme